VKRVVRVKLRVTPEQSDTLARTLRLCNEAARQISNQAFERSVFRKFDLQKISYADTLELGMGAQATIRAIGKVVDAYKTLKANARAGNLGKKGSPKFAKAMGKPISFRDTAAQPFDDRCLSWDMDNQAVSIWTVDGRMKPIPFVGDPTQVALLKEHRQGETDLVEHQGNFYLIATLDLPDVPVVPVTDFIGVDMGIVVIAATSTGSNWSGAAITDRRIKNTVLRSKLQKKGTKSAKRLLRKRSGKESRFVADVNHVISKHIVTEAERTGRGIAIEDLTGIRARARLRKPQRVALNSWAFAQLGTFITYKAEAAGVDLVIIDPAYTSQECSDCHHIDKKNRIDQATFACRDCGVTLNADDNASKVIADRARKLRGAVNLPDAA
jgi:IS605 OrfB family transposase